MNAIIRLWTLGCLSPNGDGLWLKTGIKGRKAFFLG
jgi:hypothetical protein